MKNKPIKVLLAKPGLDGHDRGAKIMARALRDGGMEVIYTGLRQTPQTIAAAAIQEDVDIIGLSILSGAHVGLTRRLFNELKDEDSEKYFRVVVGGTIPAEDIPLLKTLGVSEVFTSDMNIDEIVKRVRELAVERGEEIS